MNIRMKWFMDKKLAFPLENGRYGPRSNGVYGRIRGEYIGDNRRDMSIICPVYSDCPISKDSYCHGVVWCPVYNGGWTESHQSLRHKVGVTKEMVDEKSRYMINQIRREIEDNALFPMSQQDPH